MESDKTLLSRTFQKKDIAVTNDTFTFQSRIRFGDFRAQQKPGLEVETISCVPPFQKNTKRGDFSLLENSVRFQFSLKTNIGSALYLCGFADALP